MKQFHRNFIFAILALALIGCTTTRTRPDNSGSGRATRYESSDTPGRVGGVGLESQDVISITDRMARDILASPQIAARATAPRIVIDSQYLRNESSSEINKNTLTDRLRVGLVRAAQGRIVFLARHQVDNVEDERKLEDEGIVTGGTQGTTKVALGYDFRLGGRITSIDAINPNTSEKSRYHQITFELIERGSGQIMWANNYEFRKTAQDDTVYR
jgi:PBP1b-binding outer membrane lipoprotein LpoB